MAARKASSIVSLATTTASGWVSPGAAGSSRRSGAGWSQGSSGRQVGAARGSAVAGATSGGRTRRCRRSRAFREALVAIRYSQVRNSDRPWKPARARQARRKVSWTMSSASWTEPSIR
jgi:hypothetical protein